MSEFHESFKERNAPPKSSNFSFGITFFLLFLFVSFYFLLKQRGNQFFISLSISLLLLLITLIKKEWLDSFNSLWSKLSLFIGKITQPIIMFLLFFGIVTPLSFVLRRFFKRDFQTEIKSSINTYWITKKTYSPLDESMKNQF